MTDQDASLVARLRLLTNRWEMLIAKTESSSRYLRQEGFDLAAAAQESATNVMRSIVESYKAALPEARCDEQDRPRGDSSQDRHDSA